MRDGRLTAGVQAMPASITGGGGEGRAWQRERKRERWDGTQKQGLELTTMYETYGEGRRRKVRASPREGQEREV